MKKATLLIVTRNRAPQLSLALKSIETQNYQDISVVVVDDASQDETPRVLRDFSKLHPQIHRIERRGGYRQNPGPVLNVGHLLAKTDIVIEQCGEVCHLTDCVEPLIGACRPGRVVLGRVYSGSTDQMESLQKEIENGDYVFREDFKLDVCSNRPGALKIPYLGKDSIALYCGLERPAPLLFLAAIHKKDFGAVKGYNEKLSRAADDDLANRLQNRGVHFYFSGRAIGFHLKHGKS